MGLDDDEDPKIKVRFITEQEQAKKTSLKPPTEVKTQSFIEPRGSQPLAEPRVQKHSFVEQRYSQ